MHFVCVQLGCIELSIVACSNMSGASVTHVFRESVIATFGIGGGAVGRRDSRRCRAEEIHDSFKFRGAPSRCSRTSKQFRVKGESVLVASFKVPTNTLKRKLQSQELAAVEKRLEEAINETSRGQISPALHNHGRGLAKSSGTHKSTNRNTKNKSHEVSRFILRAKN